MARPGQRVGNLPAETTSFIGRRRELAEIRRQLAGARLVSLVGPGGVGKTRLAVRMARDLARGFREGTWWVELADVRDAALVSNAVMTALDLRDQAGADPLALLLAYVRDKDLLLVLDNCEHLLEATAQLVADVLSGAPGVRVIATSREPLSAPGEHVIPVPPLELPLSDRDESLAQLRQNEAISLFTERAAAASGGFELGASNRAAVVDICRRLDGLPLAIELAAVKTRVLGVEQIRDRLNDRFTLLTAGGRAALPRHQTLQTTIDWSYDLLPTAERTLLRRLCVFAGRFALEDVEPVCTFGDVPPAQVLNLLSSLVEKSLVIKEDVRDIACYRLHETMREYATLKLRAAGEEDTLGERCTEYYRSRCVRYQPEVRYHLAEWLEWMDLEIDNIRAVLGHCLTRRDAVRGLDLATGVAWYWITRATSEGVRWLEAFLACGRGNPEAQFWACFLRGFLAVLKADAAAGTEAIERALATARELGQPIFVSQALSMSSIAANLAGDRTAAIRFLDEANLVTSTLDDIQCRISVLQARSLHGFFGGDIAAVVSAASEGASLGREAGDLYSLEMMLLNLGGTAFITGDLNQAKKFYTEALAIARRIDDRVAEYALLDGLGCTAAGSGQARLAAQLIGAAENIRTQAGASLIPILAPMIAQAEASGAAAVGQSTWDAQLNAGKQLSRDEAIRLALGEPRTAVAAGSKQDGEVGPLGKREAAVARLVAEGLSNKQIGARLFISERTVDSHVRNILNKLGFMSRAQIAGWVSSES
ncbi:MAG TPA: LuxR C-terminal-related transcriptional regulator [Candidatus Dormibacteraeota bacterium]|nr:LuxR C-terminal-related transcriptional regulator [Candidatus Dormibacteraeota bacterium]